MQDKAEAKLRQLEARAEEQVRARAQADEEWRKQQRERELERLKVHLPMHRRPWHPFLEPSHLTH